MFLYFDPGLGALLLQFFIAVVAGIALFYRKVTDKIKAFFGMKKERKDIFDDIESDHKTQQTRDGA